LRGRLRHGGRRRQPDGRPPLVHQPPDLRDRGVDVHPVHRDDRRARQLLGPPAPGPRDAPDPRGPPGPRPARPRRRPPPPHGLRRPAGPLRPLPSRRPGAGAIGATDVTSPAPRILAFAGSLRKSSLNRRLLRYAIDGAVAAGGQVEELPPEFLQLPLYSGDME